MSEENLPDTADHVGQAAGGITGVLAGAAIGTAAGPLGVLLGGIAGAIGGWWSGRAIAEAAADITDADESDCRERGRRTAGCTDDTDIHGAYYLGHIAAANPEYAGRSFEDVEPELERGWTAAPGTHTEWPAVRELSRAGFSRGRERRARPRDTADRRSAVPDQPNPGARLG